MSHLHVATGTIDRRGSFRTLYFSQTARRIVNVKNTAKHNPHEVVDAFGIRRTVVEPKMTAGASKLPIVGTQENYFVVKMPNGTLGKIDIKTEAFLGAF